MKEIPEDVKEVLNWTTKYRILVLFNKNKVNFYLDKGESSYESIQLVPPIIIDYFFGKGFNKLADSEFERIFKEIGFKRIARIFL